MIFFSKRSLRSTTRDFVEHFHTERNHQGINHKIIEPGAEVGQHSGQVNCRQRLGGLLNYYYRKAA